MTSATPRPPVTWQRCKLGDVLAHRKERGRPSDALLSVTMDQGVIPQSEVGRRDSSSEDKSSYWRVHPGDIVYNSMRMWQGVSGISELAGIVSPAYTVCSPREGFDSQFLARLMKLPHLIQEFYRYSQGLTSDTWNLKYSRLKEIRAYVPPLPEQRLIAEILDTLDEAVRKTEQLIAKLKLVKQGLLHDLLTRGIDESGELRDPERHPEQFKDSPLGRIPREWEVLELHRCVRPDAPITYGIVQAGPHVEGGVPYIRTGDMAGDRLSSEGLLRTSMRIAASYSRSRVEAGEIVCAIRATVGKVLAVPSELHGANLTQGTARIAPASGLDRPYILWAMRSEQVQRQFELYVKGTTFREITLARLRKLRLLVPCRSTEQRSISGYLADLGNRVESEQLQLGKLRLLKTGLMDDLLTGRVRVTSLLEAEP